ncbi:SpaA isopeptide-forming pilin-related protein [Ruminococcus albus]|uniref:Cna B domain protein n=2 Tax=Ruminococcus albus TaxID=1264 RepID=E6UBC4_RUMA7|nr:hypothetical protein [Ruminococcus albus]ADU21474.1 Cna B domain protein [Ruminococcus albus 7 = DSM 20455]
MKKTFGKRFISGMTSAVLAASFVFGGFPGISSVIMSSSAEAVTGFSRENNDNRMNSGNTKVNIRFRNTTGENVNVETADNTYYLLVHCVGEDPEIAGSTVEYFNNGESRDAYDLIEINANGTDWTSPAFSLWETREKEVPSWGSQKSDVRPDVVSIDGVFLKNSAPDRELTLSDAKELRNCTVVNNIKGMELTDGGYEGDSYNGGTFSFYATGGQTVSVNIFDYNGTTLKPLTAGDDANYYLLSCLFDKGTANTDPFSNKNGIEGWSLTQFYPEDNANTQIKLWDYTSAGNTSGTLHYDPDAYEISYTVVKTPDGNTAFSSLDDTLRNGSDNIPNYRTEGPTTSGNNTELRLIRDDVRYEAQLDFEEEISITEADNIYLFIELEQTNSEYKYILDKVTVDYDLTKTIELGNLVDRNGNSSQDHIGYNGSPAKVRLLKANTGNLTVNNAVNGSNCSEIAEEGFIKGFIVNYGDQTSSKDQDTHVSTYTEHIRFFKVPGSKKYDFRSILGEGLYYGMTIDRFELGNHTETNYAVNFYEGNGQPNTPDISGKFGGHFYFADFVHFNDEINDYAEPSEYVNFDSRDFDVDPDGTFFIDNSDACCEEGAILHFDSEDRMKESAGRDGIAREYETPSAMHGVVDSIIKNMQSVSEELAAIPVNAEATVIGNNAYISGDGYPDNAVLVVDGDKIAPYVAESGKLHIELKGEQMVIFNFDELTEARIDEFNIKRAEDNDYQISTTPSNENTLEHGKNYWLDQNATRYVVWNLKSVKALDINKATGIFLIPDDDSVTRIKGTSSGWLESAGYVNNPDGEWHFLYTDLPRNTTVISVDKKDITGEAEVKGAQLRITTAEGEPVFSWESDGNTHELRLAPGDYVLEETGNEFEADDGTIYKVIPSKVSFTVKADADQESYGCTVENVKGTQRAADSDSDTGYYLYNGSKQLFTVCDAERVSTTKVTINKLDITGAEELNGAVLTIKDSKGRTVTGTPWTSAKGKKLEVELADGTYTLTETGDMITDSEGNEYEVIDSTLTFKVEDGKVTTVKNDTVDDGVSSYYDVDSFNNTITVNDAMKPAAAPAKVTITKTDITGEKEIIGAILTIVDQNGNTVEGTPWTTRRNNNKLELELAEGTYTLTETQGNNHIVDEDGNEYEVIESSLVFKIEDGKVTEVINDTSRDNGEGFFNVNSDTNDIIINDAMKSNDIVTAKVKIGKTDITGENEVENARLSLSVKGLSYDMIQTIIDSNEGNGLKNWTTAQNGEIFTMSWVSGNKAANIKGLVPATYTLTETGDAFEYNGVTYEVLDSEVVFVVNESGKIVYRSVPAPSDERVPANSTRSYAKASGTTITICDAARTDITVSKKDITASEEVKGAHLVIANRVGDVIEEWDSNGTDHIVKGLANGTYTLTETAVDAEQAGAEYKIIDSVVTFTVLNGKITDVSSSVLADKAENGSEDGFVLCDKDSNTITVCDAKKTTKVIINKFDITGKEELDGAVLTIKDSENRTVTGTPWTSQKGKKLEVELENGTYTLTETGDKITDAEGNEYEVIDSTLTFKVEDGKVTVVENNTNSNNGEGFYAVDSDTNTITVNDAKKTTKVIINKFDITGKEELDGAVLTIKDSEGRTVTGTPWTSQKGKKLEVELENGTYTLTETGDKITDAEGNEYEVIDSTLTFKVEDGKVTVVENNTNSNNGEGFYAVDSDTNTITVNDAKKTTKVIINKFDITGKEELDGAVLTIKDSEGRTVTGTPWTSAKNKKLEVELENGTYTLTETGDKITDAEGNEYEVIDSTLTFKVENGKVTVVENNTNSNSGEGFYAVDSDTNTITVNDAKKTTKVIINKFDITGKEELDGAVLTIKDSKGRTVTGTPWTSAKNKKLEVELENGTYTLTETGDKITDAEGNEYEVIDSTLTFKVEDGKVTVVENNTNSNNGEGFYAVDSDTNTITVNDAKKTTKVIINKFDITGKEELDGAVLTIKDSEGRTVTGTPWTSAKGKKLEVELENGTYTLTETGDKITDAEGNEYEVIDSTLTFKVENGKVTVVENNTNSNNGEGFYAVDSDTNTITVNDAKKTTKVIINKFDITGKEELDGAVLTIKDSEGRTVTGTPWTSQKGKKLEVELENGTYTLTETGDKITDAEGNEYEVIDSTLTFKVEDGKVTVVENNTNSNNGEGFYAVDSDTNTITVNDAKKTTKVIINKFDITGKEELDGAVLTIKDSENRTVTGTPWTSQKGKKLEVELENGTYTLTETGDKITDAEGNEYEVIDSTLTFKVENGKVTVVENNTNSNNGEGFYAVDSDTNTITVNDAKKTTKVIINKFDITGKEELDGAVLTIKDSENRTVTGTPWTSAKNKKLEVELENGTYTLTETGDKITDAEGNEYEVIDSTLTFKVEDGKVTVVETTQTAIMVKASMQ